MSFDDQKNLTLKITNIAFGGQGVGKNRENKTLFVNFTLPEEEIAVEVLHDYKKYQTAKLIKIIAPSPDRIVAKCPYFQKCGGCQLQHTHYVKQLIFKKQFLIDALERIAKISLTTPPEIIPSKEWNYRRKITLIFDPITQKIGFRQEDSLEIQPINECLIFESFDSFAPTLTFFNMALALEKQEVRLTFYSDPQYRHIHIESEKPVSEKGFNQITSWVTSIKPLPCTFSAIYGDNLFYSYSKNKLISQKESPWLYWEIQLKEQTKRFYFSPASFVQANRELASQLYLYVDNLLVDFRSKNSLKKIDLLELYCGSGILSSIIMEHCNKFIGIEYSPISIDAAKKNNSNTQAYFYCDKSENFFKWTTKTQNFIPNCLIVNPPRTGIDAKTLQNILKLNNLQFIIYISCMPATLARDLRILLDESWIIESVRLFDLFPQTTHVESVISLRRSPIK